MNSGIASRHTHKPLSILIPGKPKVFSGFKDALQPGKSTHGECEAGQGGEKALQEYGLERILRSTFRLWARGTSLLLWDRPHLLLFENTYSLVPMQRELQKSWPQNMVMMSQACEKCDIVILTTQPNPTQPLSLDV